MEKVELVKRAKMYLKMLGSGVHHVSGVAIPEESVLSDEKTRVFHNTRAMRKYKAIKRADNNACGYEKYQFRY